ncbi:ABC transporter transmembrane region 2-domain-containing protein [Paraphysoderma sedebokerense]|nr:ABC transporter transmembrane region 2-domain-containing protein [Paraphysoderma sedebokerense]
MPLQSYIPIEDEFNLRSDKSDKLRSKSRPTPFDPSFFSRFQVILKILFSRKQNKNGTILYSYTLFLVVAVLNEVIGYFVGTLPSKYYMVLINKQLNEFYALLLPSFFILLGAAVGKSVIKFARNYFAIQSRKLLTCYLQDHCITLQKFYSITNKSDFDNLDQRVTQDVDRFTDTLCKVIEQLIIAPFLIAYYTYNCWTIAGYTGPLFIYSYVILGFLVSSGLVKPLIKLVFVKEKKEGDFRYIHSQVRANAESVSFLGGESAERQRMEVSLFSLLKTQLSIIKRQLALESVTEFFAYLGSILNYLVVAIAVFTGKCDDLDSGQLGAKVSESSFVSLYLIFRLTSILEMATQFSDMAGYTVRLSQLIEYSSDDRPSAGYENKPQGHRLTAEKVVAMENVTVKTPDGVTIVRDLTFTASPGRNLLITGPSGTGKTSILRVLKGLWSVSNPEIAKVIVPSEESILFLPQSPYVISGSIKSQIAYPKRLEEVEITDDTIHLLLSSVGLHNLLDELTDLDLELPYEYYSSLSPGELQKLSFARLFFHRPVFAVLDESTSSLDIGTESALYSRCRDLDITIISVSHRQSVVKFHQVIVNVGRNGNVRVLENQGDSVVTH